MKSMLDRMKLENTRYQALEKRIKKEWDLNKNSHLSQKEKTRYHVILILMALEEGKEKVI